MKTIDNISFLEGSDFRKKFGEGTQQALLDIGFAVVAIAFFFLLFKMAGVI